ncbi:hypothetical protein SAY86_010703 [Trapa natans]|uniref:NECAP PHear domain-containing protein n=1 Tax=Trapa natans TaxID=22666 RepID=A0AAN7LK10_TRANT|nr:hypothetical protein SAY86_010703 [Trapa natans]
MEIQIKSKDHEKLEDLEENEDLELVLFQVSEYPRKTAASYTYLSGLADEWDVNKWAWEGILKVVSKGEECIIRLEDRVTGELYARAFLRSEEPHPVEPVIDSSRYFVLRVEESIGGRRRHAFLGIGFRERTEAYDFQAALHDHMKYLNKKKTAEEMEQHYQHTSSVDYCLKEGETLVLQLKNNSVRSPKSKVLEQGVSNLSLEEKGNVKEPVICFKPPPPPGATLSPAAAIKKTELTFPLSSIPEEKRKSEVQAIEEDAPDDDFGDFQTAG